MFSHHLCTHIQPFSNLSALSTIGWRPENFMMTSLTVQELSCWQTDRQTDTTENNSTIAAQMVISKLSVESCWSLPSLQRDLAKWEFYRLYGALILARDSVFIVKECTVEVKDLAFMDTNKDLNCFVQKWHPVTRLKNSTERQHRCLHGNYCKLD